MDDDQRTDPADSEDTETVEEFKEEVENDPSTAKPSEADDDGLDRLRGG
jgi:hypothetical protein